MSDFCGFLGQYLVHVRVSCRALQNHNCTKMPNTMAMSTDFRANGNRYEAITKGVVRLDHADWPIRRGDVVHVSQIFTAHHETDRQSPIGTLITILWEMVSPHLGSADWSQGRSVISLRFH